MPVEPRHLWRPLPAALRHTALRDLAASLQEVTNELRSRHCEPPGRKAVLYIRQSSPHQVLTNQESLRLQYALRQRARELGWREPDIEVIDADLGLSGAGPRSRQGFKDLIARVTLGQVGLILSADVTRLTRNCSDWYPLLDLCGYRQCLIADRDGVYDPGPRTGGSSSASRARSLRWSCTPSGPADRRPAQQGRARRAGAVAARRPGPRPVWAWSQSPDREVQAAHRAGLRHLPASSVRGQVRAHPPRAGPALPRRDRLSDITGDRRRGTSICRHPQEPGLRRRRSSTAGPYVRPACPARDRSRVSALGRSGRSHQGRVPGLHRLGYFGGSRDAARQPHRLHRGPTVVGYPAGRALLHGLVCCGACGHKITVQYKGGTRYICNHLRRQHGLPKCQTSGRAGRCRGRGHVPRAVAPAELDALGARLGGLAGGEAALRRSRRPAGRAAALSRGPRRAPVQSGRPRQPLRRRRAGAPLGGGLAPARDAERALTDELVRTTRRHPRRRHARHVRRRCRPPAGLWRDPRSARPARAAALPIDGGARRSPPPCRRPVVCRRQQHGLVLAEAPVAAGKRQGREAAGRLARSTSHRPEPPRDLGASHRCHAPHSVRRLVSAEWRRSVSGSCRPRALSVPSRDAR